MTQNNSGLTPVDIALPSDSSEESKDPTFTAFQDWKKDMHPGRMTAARLYAVLDNPTFVETVKADPEGVAAMEKLIHFLEQEGPALDEENLKKFGQHFQNEYHVLLHSYRKFYDSLT